ncbi:GDSL esterase/lipase At4g16230 isoform X2 [Hevea brasiliensis]|uniref:GDSL esterase/lipase At4g16230 isoform X2 n=1 Tax=Hevea brasiliensis TaxID=3981 RepID=UPI0025CCC337|nr:GDSL esterase/lipase At4g16230 isoform X2 [Hevea brasiliensis]
MRFSTLLISFLAYSSFLLLVVFLVIKEGNPEIGWRKYFLNCPSSEFFSLSLQMSFVSNRRRVIGITSQVLTILVLSEICIAIDIPANFVFGDSLVDAGNNNYIVTLSKANYVPNGIDFGRPTGRYTNGRTIVDIIGQEFSFEDFTPPYLAPTTVGSVVLRGVNYASGGGGILNHTGELFGGRINLDPQIDNFANTRQDIISRIVPEQKLIPGQLFVGTMIARFRLQLTRLYNLGARKIVVANVGPIGCIPYERDTNPSSGDNCVVFQNQLVQLYNTQLKSLISELSASLEGSIFIYADVYRIVEDILQNYKSYGFENANTSCCYAAGRFGGLLPCGPTSKVCVDRSKYVFWDPYHPSDAANVIIARRLTDGDLNDISPMNIRQLSAV